MEEILDVVDDHDQVIGQMERTALRAQGGHNFRVINALIVNSLGQIWIPRRTADKAYAPNALDLSVGGHVMAGETYDECFARETLEETGLDVSTLPHRILGYLTPPKDGVNAFMYVYEILADDVPNFNPSDFSEFFWLTPQAILDRLAQGDIGKGDLPIIIKHFYHL